MLFAALTALVLAAQSYTEKKTVSSGVSRQDFFFYACLCLLPFAVVMLFLTPFYFEFSYVFIIVMLVSLILRYGKMTTLFSTIEYLAPFESEAYMCLGVILAYITDCIVGIKTFSHWGILSIAITLPGVFLISDVKLQIRKLRVNLIIRIICDLGLGYCARYALIYCSNALYILILNLIIVLVFCWRYKPNYHKEKFGIIKLVAIQQFLGFLCLYFGNIVTQLSVTAYAFIRPMSLALCVIIAFFYKNKTVLGGKLMKARQPKIKDVIAIALIISGICLQTI